MGPSALLLLLCMAVLVVVLVVLYLRFRNLQLLHQERMAALEMRIRRLEEQGKINRDAG